MHFWKDGLHLFESGKVIFCLIEVNVFFNTYTSFGGMHLDDYIGNAKPSVSVSKSSAVDLEMLQNDKLKMDCIILFLPI